MITIARGNEELKVSKDSYETFFKGIGYKIVNAKKVINSKKEDTKSTEKKGSKKDEEVENLEGIEEIIIDTKKGDK